MKMIKERRKSTFVQAGKMLAAVTLSLSSVAYSDNAKTGVPQHWQMKTPITTYFAGPPMTDSVAQQMSDGGFNLVWNPEKGLATAEKHGLRVMLQDNLLSPRRSPHVLDDPVKRPQLDALIARVKNNPLFYGYYIIDEPSADSFPELGKLVAYLHEHDPGRLGYINLLPIYANNKQLGVQGDVVAAYKEYLRQYIEIVKPDLLSYDHYSFGINGDTNQYFLNLSLIRQAALDAHIPFMSIVQACRFSENVRTPNADELRWLNYTSLAYGSQGISYFVYSVNSFYQKFKENPGQMMAPDGTPTPQYEAAKQLNPQFVAIASQLQHLRSLGAYHVGKKYLGAQELPKDAPFHLDFTGNNHMPADGMLLGYFGNADKPTHVLVVNLDYNNPVTATVDGPGKLSVFDATKSTWKQSSDSQVTLNLPSGGGILVRVDK